MSKPLEGIVVLDLSRLLPGPFLTMVLSDLGADVIKVEDTRGGDYLRVIPPLKNGVSGRFMAVNRDKRSIAIDLKSADGRAAFLRLVDKADVVVESFRPGVMDKLGVGWNTLKQRAPRLVMCSISGYGQDGPLRTRAGHDLNYIALAGVLAMTGPRDGAPQMPGVQIADLAGGALWSATGILAALVGREKTGQGEHIDISMTEGAMALLCAELGNMAASSANATRGTETLNGGLAHYGVYQTKDQKYLSVGPLEPKFYSAFCQAIGRKANMAELGAPVEKQDEIRQEIADILKKRTRDEWVAHMDGMEVCCEPVLELSELSEHPLHKARGVFFEVNDPVAGPVAQMRTPLGGRDAKHVGPKLGQHTDEVLAEFGFSADEIAELKAANAVT